MANPWDSDKTVSPPGQASTGNPWDSDKTVSPGVPPTSSGGFRTLPGSSFPTKQIDLGNGKTSEQRPDGGVWFGPDQGNTGLAGWFDAKGNRMSLTPGQGEAPGFWSSLVKQGLPTAGKAVMQAISQMSMGHPDPQQANNPENPINKMNQSVASDIAGLDRETAQGGMLAKLGSGVGHWAPAVAATALTGGEAAPTFWGRVAANALPVASSTYMLAPGSEEQKAQSALGAVAALPVGQVAGERVIGPAAKYIGSKLSPAWADISAPFFGGAPPEESTNPLASGIRRLIVGKYGPEAQKIMDDLTSQGVEARPSTILNAAKVATPSEEVAASRTSMQNLTDALAQNTENTPYRGLDRVAKAAAAGDTEAQDLITRVSAANASPEQVAQTSGSLQAKRAQLIKNDLWGKVNDLAGDNGVPLPKTYDAIQSLRDTMGQKGDIPGLSSELDRLDRYFPQRDPDTGRMVSALNPDKNFSDLKLDVVQRLNDILSTRPDNADAYALQRAAGQLKNAVQGDMHDFASNSGNDALWNAYNRANNFHSNVYAPTQQAQPFNIQNVFATDSAKNPTFADQLISKLGQKSSGPDRASAVANALGTKGRAAFAQALVENSVQKGIVDRTGTWVPGGAASDLAGRMDTINALLPKGPERMQVQGALNMLQHIAKASPENASALGERFSQVAASGEGITGKIANAYNFVKNGGIDLLFNSPKGKSLLFAMNEAKPGSPEAGAILQKMINLQSSASSPAHKNTANMESR